MDESKKKKIAETRKRTKERRANQFCKAFELKVDKSHLSKKTLNDLGKLFVEGKWLYNHILASGGPVECGDTSIKGVGVKVGENIEMREITMPAQMKQEIRNSMLKAIRSLSKLRKTGKKIGKLRFKKYVKCLPLNQYRRTHEFFKNYARIQGIKQRLKVHGMKQIHETAEFSNAYLIQKHGDYFIKVNCWFMKKENIGEPKEKPNIGIDFGIGSQMTFSNGVKLLFQVPPSKRTRRLGQRLSRCQSHSKNWFNLKTKLEKSLDYENNQKKDIKNKVLSCLERNYNKIAIQNDSIKGWQCLFGKKIHNTAIGKILRELKQRPRTLIAERFFPSTKQCRMCGTVNEHMKIGVSTFECRNCGHSEDRDVHSARNILIVQLPGESRDFKPVENETDTFARKLLSISKFCSVKQEAIFRLAEKRLAC